MPVNGKFTYYKIKWTFSILRSVYYNHKKSARLLIKKFYKRNQIWKYLRRRVVDLRATWDKKQSSWKNFLIFFQKKLFLYFGKWNFLVSSLKNSYIFSKKEFLYFKELAQRERQKQIHSKRISYIFSKKVLFMFWITADRAVKQLFNTLR